MGIDSDSKFYGLFGMDNGTPEDVALTELLNAVNKMLRDNAMNDGKEPTEQELFDMEMESEVYYDVYTSTCAMLMAISTAKNIPLDRVIEMYVEKIRKELESDYIKALMSIGKTFMGSADNE